MNTPKSKNKSKSQNSLGTLFIKRLAYLLLCALPIYLLANEKSDLRLIVIPLLFLGGYQLIPLGYLCIQIIEHYFPTKTYNNQNTIGEKIVYYGSFIYFVGFFYAIISFGRGKNVLGEWDFFLKYGCIGIFIAIIILIILKLIVATVYEDYYRRLTLWFIVPLTTLLLVPALAFQYNASIERKKYEISNYKVVEKITSGRRSKTYSLKIQTSFGEEKLKVPKKFHDYTFVGSILQLKCYKGQLGYYVVDEIHVK